MTLSPLVAIVLIPLTTTSENEQIEGLNIETMATMVGRGYNNPPRDSYYLTSHSSRPAFFLFPHLTRRIQLGSKVILVLVGTLCSMPLDQNNAVIPSII